MKTSEISRLGGAAALAAALLWSSPGGAQQSLFAQPLAPEAQAEPKAEGAKPKPRPKPKPRGPVPARALTVTNASSNTLTGLEVSGEGKTATLAKPLAPQGRTVLKLPAMKGCAVSVTASFEGQLQAEATEHDICKDKTIRFTE